MMGTLQVRPRPTDMNPTVPRSATGLFLALLFLSSLSACKKADSPTLPDPGSPVPSSGCPVAAIPVAVNAAGVTFDRSTTGAGNHFEGASCQSGTGAPDEVYVFTLASQARVQVMRAAAWDLRVSLRFSSCTGAETVCFSGTGSSERELASGTYYLIVDGDLSTDSGEYQLGITDVTP